MKIMRGNEKVAKDVIIAINYCNAEAARQMRSKIMFTN